MPKSSTIAMLLFGLLFGLLSFNDTHASNLDDLNRALVDAVERREWKRSQELLASDPESAKQTQPDGMTPLHWAVFHGQTQLVRQLISAKADVNAKTQYDVTPLSLGCMQGDSRSVELLLAADAKVHETIDGGTTPLMTAARQGNRSIVKALIAKGSELNATEKKGQTALMWAAAEGNQEAVQALIDAGADLRMTSKSGFNAMMFAAREGRFEVVKSLLNAGIDVNEVMVVKNSKGRSPRNGVSALMMAIESGHLELGLYLVERGADPNDQRSEYAPLHAITWVRKPKTGEDPDGDPSPRGSGNISSLEFVRRLVAAGADVNLQLSNPKQPGKAKLNPKGATPFLFASKTADLPLLKLLLELGADPQLTNADGCTPLLAAAGVGTVAVDEEPGTEPEVIELVEFLMGLGADPSMVDKNGETVMHGAAYRAYPKVVDLFAKRGLRPEIWDHKNKHGWTPMKIAEGSRPGSVKPSPAVIAALTRALQ